MAQMLANIIIVAARYGLTALGLSLIYRCAGYLDFGQGAMFLAGAYAAYEFSVHAQFPLVVALPLGAVAAAVGGLAVDQLIYRPLRRKERPVFAIMLASLGLLVIVENAIALRFSDAALSLPLGDPRPGHLLLGARVTDQQMVIMAAAIGVASAAAAYLRFTRTGLRLRALGSDRVLVTMLGAPTQDLFVTSAFLGSLLSGTAGALSALELDMYPTVGSDALLPAVLIALLGGAGNMRGALLAGLIMAALEGLVGTYISLLWREAAAFVVVLALIYVRPRGLFSRRGGQLA